MAIQIIPFLVTALKWLGRIGLAVFAINEVKKLTTEQKAVIEKHTTNALATGISDDEYKKIGAATLYDQVEQDGQEPDDFWAGLSEGEKKALKFSPETLRQDTGRTKFLGIAAALLFVGALAAGGVAGIRGIPILLSTLSKIAEARKTGASALSLLTIIEEGKIAGIAAVWIPGLIAGIAGAFGWLTSSMTNNLNDATLWGRIFLGQAADDFEKVKRSRDAKLQVTGDQITAGTTPKTIIRMVTEKKPEQFIGTLFSAKLGAMESFNRVVDDEITDEADLIEDVKLNLTKWLTSLPGRLGYSVVIRKDPVDEFGVKQSGTWATLTTHFTRLSGPIQPIDTILLGPVTPATKLKLSKTLRTVELQIPGMLKGQDVRQIEVPGGAVDIFDTTGERVDLSAPRIPVAEAPIIAPTPEIPVAEEPTPLPTPAPSPPAPVAPIAAGIKLTPVSELTKPQPRATPAPVAGAAPTPAPVVPPFTVEPPAPAPPKPDFDVNEFENGVRGSFIQQLGVFENQILRVNTGGGNLNARAGSTTKSAIIFKIPNNTKVVVDRFSGVADGFQWAQIRTKPGNKTAFVAVDFLEQL